MGTDIDSFFRRGVEQNPRVIVDSLDATFSVMQREISILIKYGGFSSDRGEWYVTWCENMGSIKYLTGEGPPCFSIDVYEQVIAFGSVERFSSISERPSPIAIALRKIFCSVAQNLGSGSELAIGCGGFGETDHAIEAANAGNSFVDVVEEMRKNAGKPATTWEQFETGDYNWYLGAVGSSLPFGDAEFPLRSPTK